MKKVLFILFCSLIFIVSCEKNPVRKLTDPTASNTVNNWSGRWVVYDDENKTAGAIMMFNSMDGQELDFNWRKNPHSGVKCIKYSWDGSSVYSYDENYPGWENTYCGFAFIVAESVSKYSSTTKNMDPGAFTKISFWARGALNSDVSLRLESNNGTSTSASGTNAWQSNNTTRKITDSWQKYEFSISGSLAAANKYVSILIKFDGDNSVNGNGGTVYIDDIELSR